MTKLTIQHEWNTYSWIGDNYEMLSFFKDTELSVGTDWCVAIHNLFPFNKVKYTYKTIDELVAEWYMKLQPQEENPVDTFDKNCKYAKDTRLEALAKVDTATFAKDYRARLEENPEETDFHSKETWDKIPFVHTPWANEQSILQKLRAELGRLPRYLRSKFSADCSRHETPEERNTEMVDYSQVESILNELEDKNTTGVFDIAEDLMKHLDSLKETQHIETTDFNNNIWRSDQSPNTNEETQPEWKPSFRETIEVSNDDWEDNWWIEAIFLHKDSAWYYCCVVRYWEVVYEYFDHARPAPEELKLGKLPEFDYEKIEENVRDVEFEKIDEIRHIVWHIGKQLEAITKYLQRVNLINKSK